MKVELPPSASLYQGRAAPQPRRPRPRRRLLPAALAALAVGALAAGGFRLADRLARPGIERLEPAIGEPGQVLRIEGRNFGAERGDSRVEVDGIAPTASSYVSWEPASLSFRLPAAVDSGLVYVVTRRGRSNAKLFMNRARLPVRAEGARAGRAGPFISSLSAESGPIGSLLVLTGLDFGANRESSAVSFTWTADLSAGTAGAQSLPSGVSSPEVDLGYELWSDREIRVRVPDGAVSGAVTVTRDKSRSNGIFFQVVDAPGFKRYTDRRTYALAQSIDVSKVAAAGPNELYLWTPRPVEAAYQRGTVLAQEPPALVPDYRGASLFRFKDLQAGAELKVAQSYLVQVYGVECEVEADKVLARPADPPPLMARYLAADERVPAADPDVQAAARRICRGERNPWRAARLLWDWLVANVAWSDRRELARPQDAFERKSADSYSYALLTCALLRAAGVPSLPVAGYLADPGRRAVRHYWVEVYLYGLGWVPLDPILGSGARPAVDVAWEDRSRYFGNMDNRHVAFSRGIIALASMAPGGRRVAKERRWSLQDFYEEATGGLRSYSSFWGDVEVTGMY